MGLNEIIATSRRGVVAFFTCIERFVPSITFPVVGFDPIRSASAGHAPASSKRCVWRVAISALSPRYFSDRCGSLHAITRYGSSMARLPSIGNFYRAIR
jgi:hypothetical protein